MRRSKYLMIAQLLEAFQASDDGLTAQKALNLTKLQPSRGARLLKYLMDHGLVEGNKGAKARITEKGVLFLECWERLNAICELREFLA